MAGTQNSGESELTQNRQDSALGQAKGIFFSTTECKWTTMHRRQTRIRILLYRVKRGTGYGNHQTKTGTTTDWFRRWKRRYMV